MKVKFEKLNPNAVIPTKAHPTDAGADLTATSREVHDDVVTYGTGIATEIPEGYVGLVFPRSSVYKTGMRMCNSVGVIDSGYRDEILVKFYCDGGDVVPAYEVGDRIAQMIILPYPQVEYVEADKLSETDRGLGGFGSTGK